jgi:hypothetical protein
MRVIKTPHGDVISFRFGLGKKDVIPATIKDGKLEITPTPALLALSRPAYTAAIWAICDMIFKIAEHNEAVRVAITSPPGAIFHLC